VLIMDHLTVIARSVSDEAIHRACHCGANGLLRFARNDDRCMPSALRSSGVTR
jgi:hypothetical protein